MHYVVIRRQLAAIILAFITFTSATFYMKNRSLNASTDRKFYYAIKVERQLLNKWQEYPVTATKMSN